MNLYDKLAGFLRARLFATAFRFSLTAVNSGSLSFALLFALARLRSDPAKTNAPAICRTWHIIVH